jgi:mono/diheme cytochrome c family protein
VRRTGSVAIVAALAALALGGCDRRVAGGRADGPAVFAEACARCHGDGGVPSRAMVAQLGVKDLTSAHVQRELTDEQIRRQILEGSDNRRMPAFAAALTAAQVDALIVHVRTLAAPGAHPPR